MVAKTVPPPDDSALPRHVAIIMDGNGRWAEGRGLARLTGHQRGIEPVREVVRNAAECGIEALTLFAFSSENFERPADEVSGLMVLFLDALDREIAELDANGVRLGFIGDRQVLGPALVDATRAAETRTKHNTGLKLSIAVAYGGRWDIVQAAQRLAEKVSDGQLDPANIDAAAFASMLSTDSLPPVDLLIRTGGEYRISNFLLWDLAYSELYFSRCLWPEFDRAEFEQALEFFAGRQRKFGRTASQVGISAC
jgi:undecaprenyl diphosphate synthase